MPTEQLSTVSEIIDVIEQNDGLSGTELAREVNKRADRIDDMQTDTRDTVHATFMAESVSSQVQDTTVMRQTAKDIEVTVGHVKTGNLDPYILGQANQDRDGSAVLDVSKNIDADGTLDRERQESVRKHEETHEGQSDAPNADAIDLTPDASSTTTMTASGNEPGSGNVVTWWDVSEVHAMRNQGSLKGIDTKDYLPAKARIEKLLTSSQIEYVATTGDMQSLQPQAVTMMR